MKYIESLFDYNKDSKGVIEIDGGSRVLKSPEELREFLLEQFNYVAQDNAILEFDLEEFMNQECGTNLDLILEKVMELTEFTQSMNESSTPLLTITKTIIKTYLDKIKDLIDKEKEKLNDNN